MISNVSQIIAAADIVDVIGRRVKLTKSGSNWKACCPFHAGGNERSASLVVTPSKNIWHCFACGAGTDMLDFLRLFDHLEFQEGVEVLAAEVGIQVEYGGAGEREVGIKRQDLYGACAAAAIHYANQLRAPENSHALDYAHKRGLTDAIITKWQLGYACGDRVADCGADPDALVDAGILKRPGKDSQNQRLYDALHGRLIIPLHDHAGRTIAFAGRLIPNPESKSETDRAKYLNTSDTPIFKKGDNLYGYKQAQEIARLQKRPPLVVEGQLKAIAAQEAGLPAVAPCGTAFTERQATLLSRMGERINLAFDRNPAGIQAALKAAQLLRQMELDVHCLEIQIPENWGRDIADPDELLAAGHPIQYAEIGIFVEWAYRRVLSHPKGTPAWAKEITDKILPLISEIPNAAVRHTELRALSEISEIPLADLKGGRATPPPASKRQSQGAASETDPQNQKMTAARYLCAVALQIPLDMGNHWSGFVDWIRLPPPILQTLRLIAWVRDSAARSQLPLATAISQAHSLGEGVRSTLGYWAAVELPNAPDFAAIEKIQKRIIADAELQRQKEGNPDAAA